MKRSSDILQSLSQTSFFEGLTSEAIANILQCFTPCSLIKADFIFYQGDVASRMFVLLSGRLKVTQSTTDGQQVVLRLIHPGDIFGCVAALSQSAYPGSAEATRDSQALYLEASRIPDLMRDYPALSYNAFQIMVKRVHELQDRYRELATENVADRLAHALLRMMKQNGKEQTDGSILLDVPLSRQNLAEMTGTTLYTVSRLLQQWSHQGLIRTGREKVVLLQPALLAAQSEPGEGEPG